MTTTYLPKTKRESLDARQQSVKSRCAWKSIALKEYFCSLIYIIYPLWGEYCPPWIKITQLIHSPFDTYLNGGFDEPMAKTESATTKSMTPAMESLVRVHRVFEGISPDVSDQAISESDLLQSRIGNGFDLDEPQVAMRYACLLNGYASRDEWTDTGPRKKMAVMHLQLRAYDPAGQNAHDDTTGIRTTQSFMKNYLEWMDRSRLDAMYHYWVHKDQHFRDIEGDLYEGNVLTDDGRQYLLDFIGQIASVDGFAKWLHGYYRGRVQVDESGSIRTPDIARAFSIQHFISTLYRTIAPGLNLGLKLRWDAGLSALGVSIVHSSGKSIPPNEELSSVLREIDADWYPQLNGTGGEAVLSIHKQRFAHWGRLTPVLWPVIGNIERLIEKLAADNPLNENEKERLWASLGMMSEFVARMKVLKSRPRTRVDRVMGIFLDCYREVLNPYDNLRLASDVTEERFGHDTDAYWKNMAVLAKRLVPLMYLARSVKNSISHIFFSGQDIPDLTVTAEVPLTPFEALNWGDTHDLLHRIQLSAAMFASCDRPIHLHMSTTLDEESGYAILSLEDRSEGHHYARHINLLGKRPDLYPAMLREIPPLAARIAPAGVKPSFTGSSLRFPIATAIKKPG